MPGAAAADLRVLHLSSLYAPFAFGGAERVVELLAEQQVAKGLEVAVSHLVPRPRAATIRNGVEVLPLRHRNPLWIEDSAAHRGPVRNFNKIATLFNPLTARDFSRVIDTFRPDLVHTHSMVELPPTMWDRAKSRGIRIVHTLHDFDLLCIRAALFKDGRRCEPRHRSCALFSRVKHRHHHCIDHVVAVSDAVLRTHLEFGFFGQLPASRRHVIWNPTRPQVTHAPREERPSRRPLRFGFLGRLVAEKGLSVLLQACRIVRPDGWTLEVAGRAPADDGEFRRQAEGLPVTFLGFADASAFLASIDVLVVPSVWIEPFGLTVVEAYAAGVKVIGSDIGGIGDIVRLVDPSALCAAGDVRALAARMQALVDGGSLALDAAAVDRLLRRVDPDAVVERYLEVYARARAG